MECMPDLPIIEMSIVSMIRTVIVDSSWVLYVEFEHSIVPICLVKS